MFQLHIFVSRCIMYLEKFDFNPLSNHSYSVITDYIIRFTGLHSERVLKIYV